jgi:NADP-dependent aldehyde dehydrogenase
VSIRTVNPATGEVRTTNLVESDAAAVETACRRAAEVFAAGSPSRAERAVWLRAAADTFEDRREDLIATTAAETALPTTGRLEGELARVCHQMRLFAEVVEEGSFLEATIDHPGPTPMGPRPDLRRMLVPTGPIAVFGASNFPLAFSVPGGDTVAALAAGCPVIVKAHAAHPLTSALCAELLRGTAAACDLKPDLLQVVYGFDAGRHLVQDERITAVSFTGSLQGGQALMDLIAARRDPIPFYGELSGLNPAVVTPGAARDRAGEVADGLVGAITGSVGQLCTKPGLVFVPAGVDGDAIVTRIAEALLAVAPAPLLTERIADSYRRRTTELGTAGRVMVAEDAESTGHEVSPFLLETNLGEEPAAVWEETFGPTTTVLRYGDEDQLRRALARMHGSLAASIHHSDGEEARVDALATVLARASGRVVFNAQTTGVAVTWAQHHGGPWPATNSQHSSVGPTAIRRYLRPLAWQNAPSRVLPAELRDVSTGIPRRVDGTWSCES